jgi:peroxiredoxin
MKKIFIYLLTLFAFSSCKENPNFVLQGKWENGLENDTLYVYYETDKGEQIDTITIMNGKFNYERQYKRPTILRFLKDNLHNYPIFAENNTVFTLDMPSIDTKSWKCQGGKLQQEFAVLQQQLLGLSKQEQRVVCQRYIGKHPFSLVSVYCIEHYYLPVINTHAKEIEQLIKSLSGNLQDLPQVRRWLNWANNYKYFNTGRRMPGFNLEGENRKSIRLSDYDDGLVLITFWASWKKQSKDYIQLKKELQKKYRKQQKKKRYPLYFVDISLDQDRAAWQKAIQEDSLTSIQCCSFNGWNHHLIKKLNINSLPTNFLIDKQRIIQSNHIFGNDLKDKIATLIQKKDK